MERTFITAKDTASRSLWVDRIKQLSGDFGSDSDRLGRALSDEISQDGTSALISHLRLCGAIPESYGYDSSAEKLYAKYTDLVIHEAFKAIGLVSTVLRGRTGVADVECVCSHYSFVADAKAFRLSRTANTPIRTLHLSFGMPRCKVNSPRWVCCKMSLFPLRQWCRQRVPTTIGK